MLDHVILFTGPAGAGTTTAIRSISRGDLFTPEAEDLGRAEEIGEITLGEHERVRLVGIPARSRSALAARLQAERPVGLVLLVAHTGPDTVEHLLPFLDDAGPLVHRGGVVVGVTHLDGVADTVLDDHARAMRAARPDADIPVLPIDPRDTGDVRIALLSLLANREVRTATE